MDIPEPLVERYQATSAGRSWLKKLPHLIDAALKRWSLDIDTDEGNVPWTGYSGIAVPVRRTRAGASGAGNDGASVGGAGGSSAGAGGAGASGEESRAVLKVSFPHEGLAVDHEALRLWHTPSVVRLLEMDASDHAFLLERLDGNRALSVLPVAETVPIWGEVTRAVSVDTRSIDWSPAELELLDRVPRQGGVAAGLLRDLSERWERLDHPLEPWLYQHAVDFLGGWLRDGQRQDALVNTDMHFENILARLPGDVTSPNWVMIDPQVIIGEPEFSLAPLLWNRVSEYDATDPIADVQKRAHEFADAAGMDVDLALKWSVVRNLDNALGTIDERQKRAADQHSASTKNALANNDLASSEPARSTQAINPWAARSVWVAAASMGRQHPGLAEYTDFPPL